MKKVGIFIFISILVIVLLGIDYFVYYHLSQKQEIFKNNLPIYLKQLSIVDYSASDQVFLYKADEIAKEFDKSCIPLLGKTSFTIVSRSHMASKTRNYLYTYYFRCFESDGYVVTCEYSQEDLTDASPILECVGKEDSVRGR